MFRLNRQIVRAVKRTYPVARDDGLRSRALLLNCEEPDAKQPTYTLRVGKTTQEWDREGHQAKLDDIREQVSTGALVIRQMTDAERATWAQRRAMLETSLTSLERATRNRVLRNRRTRAERLS